MAKLAVVLTLLLLGGCAGLLNMSDDWCTRHAGAPPSRCPR